MGVFRFNEDNDKELMREVIATKPFSAQYGRVGQTWENVAAGVSRAVGAQLNAKQVQDRLRLLKKHWRAGELHSAVGSGIEESLDAVNEQSHYVTLPGLIQQYVRLEEVYAAVQKEKSDKEKEKAASLELCASKIISDSDTRRALRNLEEQESFFECEDAASDCVSAGTCDSASTKSTPAKPSKKRVNAFEAESERLDKRARDEFDLRKQPFEEKMEWQKQQHSELLALERSRELAREEAEKQNRELILECAKIFSAALAKNREWWERQTHKAALAEITHLISF